MKGDITPRTSKASIRTCVACRVKKPKKEFIRFVVSANELIIDDTMKVQARGNYVCSTDCLEKYCKRHKSKLTITRGLKL